MGTGNHNAEGGGGGGNLAMEIASHPGVSSNIPSNNNNNNNK